MERNFIGYGPNVPQIQWPGNAQIAISFVVNYEEGSERSILDGDIHHESNGEVPSPVPPDQRDLFNESFFEYGSRVGVWRLLDILDKYGAKATFFSCALAMERNPQVAKQVVERGHEICGHGYRWEEYHSMDRDTEKESISKTIESLTQTCGERPLGWFTRYGASVNTRELIAEEGGFIYDSISFNDDLPYFVNVKDKPWLVLPYSMETNDARFWRGGLVSTGDFYEYLKDTFDCLYEEGKTHPKMMSVGLHCRISGRPARSLAVEKFLGYVNNFPNVWIAPRIDIANWWLTNYSELKQ